MSNTDSPTIHEQRETAADIVSVTSLLEQQGTVPFLGMTDTVDAEYPDDVTGIGNRYVRNEAQSFKEALSVLPHAGEGELWADNEFVEPNDDSTVDVDLEAIRDVHGLDVADLENRTGLNLESMVARANPESLISVDSHKDIVDRRRLALRTLGFDVRFRWQIASSRYSPGDMHEFFKRKIAACQKHAAEDAFGWIRHYDWGGSVTITTIYPSKAYEIGEPDDTEIDLQNDELTIAKAASDVGVDGDDAEEDTVTIYYGDQMGYDFRGRRKLWVKPVIYIPDADVMVPLPSNDTDFARKHTGNLMEDAIDWHEQILSKIDDLCEDVNQEITRARLVSLDFGKLPFTIKEFYQHLGVQNEKYAEKAANRAKSLAPTTGFSCPHEDCDSSHETREGLRMHSIGVHSESLGDLSDELKPDEFPHPAPSLWNLQLSLKMAILDNYSGAKAGKTYREYQELAGEILRHPATQITLAKEQHRIVAGQDDDEVEIDAEQQTLGESLGEVMDLEGVTENRINATDAQKIESRIQQRLPTSNSTNAAQS